MKKLLAFLFGCCMLTQAAITQAANTEEQTIDKVLPTLQQYFPNIAKDNVKASPIAGLYQITHGPSVVYVTENGKYLISGDIIDTKNNFKNITEVARRSARVQSLTTLKNAKMIQFAPAKENKHTIWVFTDLDCPYCQKFHQHMKTLNDNGVTVNYLAFPRGGINSKSYEKTVHVWCAKDPQQAISQAKDGKKVAQAMCDNHGVDTEFQMGVMMGVTGTPSIVLENGVIIPGYVTPEQLQEIFSKLEQM